MFVEHKEAVEVTEAPAKTLKLSDAIRIGIKAFPEKGYEYYDGCALCCAGHAIGRHSGGALDDKWPELRREMLDPSGMHRTIPLRLQTLVSFLNGFHRDDRFSPQWSRERIADWLQVEGF